MEKAETRGRPRRWSEQEVVSALCEVLGSADGPIAKKIVGHLAASRTRRGGKRKDDLRYAFLFYNWCWARTKCARILDHNDELRTIAVGPDDTLTAAKFLRDSRQYIACLGLQIGSDRALRRALDRGLEFLKAKMPFVFVKDIVPRIPPDKGYIRIVGYIAAVPTGPGEWKEIKAFDPDAERIVMVPPLVGSALRMHIAPGVLSARRIVQQSEGVRIRHYPRTFGNSASVVCMMVA